MAFPNRQCPFSQQISDVNDTITGLTIRVRGLEDLLDSHVLSEDKRNEIESEIIEIKNLLDRNKKLLSELHKENTKTYIVIACLVFIVFLIYGIYCMFVYG